MSTSFKRIAIRKSKLFHCHVHVISVTKCIFRTIVNACDKRCESKILYKEFTFFQKLSTEHLK